MSFYEKRKNKTICTWYYWSYSIELSLTLCVRWRFSYVFYIRKIYIRLYTWYTFCPVSSYLRYENQRVYLLFFYIIHIDVQKWTLLYVQIFFIHEQKSQIFNWSFNKILIVRKVRPSNFCNEINQFPLDFKSMMKLFIYLINITIPLVAVYLDDL